MHMGSYESLLFFQISNTGWFHTFTEFWNHLDIGWEWDDIISEAGDAFLRVNLDYAAAKITGTRLHDNFQVSHLVAKFELCKNLS